MRRAVQGGSGCPAGSGGAGGSSDLMTGGAELGAVDSDHRPAGGKRREYSCGRLREDAAGALRWTVSNRSNGRASVPGAVSEGRFRRAGLRVGPRIRGPSVCFLQGRPFLTGRSEPLLRGLPSQGIDLRCGAHSPVLKNTLGRLGKTLRDRDENTEKEYARLSKPGWRTPSRSPRPS
eukprot:2771265-Pyramimonas_sp.AAC.1